LHLPEAPLASIDGGGGEDSADDGIGDDIGEQNPRQWALAELIPESAQAACGPPIA
jgi:hypothetical protein